MDVRVHTGRSTPLLLTSCGQDEFKFGRSTPRSARGSNLLQLSIDALNSAAPDLAHLMADLYI